MVLLGVIVLVFVGPEQLPEVARNLARFINELRRTTREFQGQFTDNIDLPKIWDKPLPPPANSIAARPVDSVAPVPAAPVSPADNIEGKPS